ncbi:MAG: protein-glutamate O-methyltransferase CheR [Desulfobacteraceae bacterium]|nr:protein-glutamate O-methyltransferase CheR [Desulfobacteraceae bacterium]
MIGTQSRDLMDDQQFRQLLQHLGFSWEGYRKVRKGVKKRIRRHMHDLGCQNLTEYLLEIDRNDETRHQCERLMTVSISRFFRDRKLWEILQTEILPELIEKNKGKLRVWSAGCASGEEAYSLKILWDVTTASIDPVPDLEITATDLNPAYLERARAGIYPASSLRELPEPLRSAHFQAQAGGKLYALRASLKEGITWQIHDLLSDPPGSQFHLIFLRNNLLTYYGDEIKRSVLKKVIDHLSTGGFLIIGSHETLPFEWHDLCPSSNLHYVFEK